MPEKDGLVFEHIRLYLNLMRQKRTGKLGNFERCARAEDYPITDAQTADLLTILCRLKNPKRILEIGTCVGFSAILMSQCCPESEIITIERNKVMSEPAKKNFIDFEVKNVQLIEGDAAKIIPELSGLFDMVYIDAAKGQYPLFLKQVLPKLAENGLIAADNVLFNGYVALGKEDVRRNKTIVNRLDTFLDMLKNNLELDTVILPISDGVTISMKK